MEKDIKILAIESSCDETAASVSVNGRIASSVVASQIDIHRLYGGVVPEIASRNHLLNISGVTQKAVADSGLELEDLDCVAVTHGPGLVGALLVGVSYAKALSYSLGCRFMGVNHMQSHISACFLAGAVPPFICLVVSGGHTMIVDVTDYTEFEVLGTTRDDAAGEAFDKVARVLGLEYPGGARLDELAQFGDPASIDFPLAMLGEDNYDFSFSGLKSAVLNLINTSRMKGEEFSREDICA
ncbi:MAG: tRNA (adenosine(37)-N6)-threonylcarbamoyltransferase complex transferase subunit TsaD, partial [Eubacteriaceae bacterium]|nr:tRNA (adenosine(37)-N6)-threonylcarbamoyltransferase complex transferase subunit TsaD [Eubacteriaceae bacterium]